MVLGVPCKKTFYEKEHCIEHIKRDHPHGGGKITKVLVRKKNNNKPEEASPEKKDEPVVYRCKFCHVKFTSTDSFHVNFLSFVEF